MGRIDTLLNAQFEGRAPWTDIIKETQFYVIFKDKYPVTSGHVLFVPKFNTTSCISKCVTNAIKYGNELVNDDSTDITGFNIGINNGKSAGQTIFYPHIHLICRRDGDIPDPTGGIRNIFPNKGNYLTEEKTNGISTK